MSSFHTLSVVFRTGLRTLRAKNELDRLIDANGGLHHTTGNHRRAAAAISKSPLVERVVVTFVTEHNDSTYRKGRKS